MLIALVNINVEKDSVWNESQPSYTIIEIHTKRKSYGYLRIATLIKADTGWIVSDILVHKCCKFSNTKSKEKHYKKANKGKENTVFTNTVAGNWNVEKPLETVVSDMIWQEWSSCIHLRIFKPCSI